MYISTMLDYKWCVQHGEIIKLNVHKQRKRERESKRMSWDRKDFNPSPLGHKCDTRRLGRNLHSVTHEPGTHQREDSFYIGEQICLHPNPVSRVPKYADADESNIKKLFRSTYWDALLIHGSFLRALRLIVREAVDPH